MPRSLTNHIDSPKAVGIRLREARLRAGLSQRKLAFPGCTAAYLSRIEAGERVPSLQMLTALAERVGVRTSWLAKGNEQSDEDLQWYREGYADALRWVLEEMDLDTGDRDQIKGILDPDPEVIGVA